MTYLILKGTGQQEVRFQDLTSKDIFKHPFPHQGVSGA